jgi:hypothetical protein
MVGRVWTDCLLRSDRSSELGERDGDALDSWCFDSEFVVAAAQVLHESVTGNDHLRGPIRSEPAHRSEPVLELTVVSLDRIVGIPFDVMPRRRALLHWLIA